MANAIFPKEWWLGAPRDYDNALITLRALGTKDTDSGTKDVSIFELEFGDDVKIDFLLFSRLFYLVYIDC
jgi:hypothetical protein